MYELLRYLQKGKPKANTCSLWARIVQSDTTEVEYIIYGRFHKRDLIILAMLSLKKKYIKVNIRI